MPDNEDELATDVLYNLLNRRTSAIKPLPTRINEVIGQYINAGRKNDLDHILPESFLPRKALILPMETTVSWMESITLIF